MKNNKYIALLIAPLLLTGLVGCNETNTSSSEPEYRIDPLVTSEINKARKSFTLKSKEIEHIFKKGTEIEIKANEYYHEVKSMSEDVNRIYKRTHYQENGENVDMSLTLTRDERGFACEEKLDYKNEVSLKPILVNGAKINYDIQFFNPFDYIEPDDLTLDGDSYLLEPSKELSFSYALNGNISPLDEVRLTFDDKGIKNILTKSSKVEDVYYDKNSEKYIPVDIYSDTIMLLSEVGSTQIEGLKPIASRNKEKEDLLKNALQALGNNYTIIMNEHDRGVAPNPEYNNVWYFNGSDAVYHQHAADDQSRKFDLYYKADKATYGDELLRYYDFNEETLKWEYNIPQYSQSYNSNPQGYDYFVLKNESIAPELFNYDEESDTYICDSKDVVGYLGNNFLPGCYTIAYFTLGQGDKCEIKLTSDHKVKEIVVGYTRIHDGYEMQTDFTLTFLNIGTTKIPSWVEGK